MDGHGHAGFKPHPGFDTLLAKVIVHAPSADFGDVLQRAERALASFRLEGAPSNIAFLRALIDKLIAFEASEGGHYTLFVRKPEDAAATPDGEP